MLEVWWFICVWQCTTVSKYSMKYGSSINTNRESTYLKSNVPNFGTRARQLWSYVTLRKWGSSLLITWSVLISTTNEAVDSMTRRLKTNAFINIVCQERYLWKKYQPVSYFTKPPRAETLTASLRMPLLIDFRHQAKRHTHRKWTYTCLLQNTDAH